MSSGQVETPINSVEVGTSLAPLAVQETGGALKVHTDTPHLVSLGGGRLSTAVTLHPLPSGRVTVGSGNNVDIPVHGTGVEPVHCHIENVNGVVTLYPVSQTITIDGLNVVSPTRLAQGVIITLGRSNYMRFNHPAEAKLMKSVLPNPRISMGPIQFYPTNNSSPTNNNTNNDTSNSRKPPVAPKKSPRESWESSIPPEENTILSKVSKFELFASQHIKKSQFSPKVFPADLITVNTPAKDVLGRNPPTNLHNLTKNLQNSAVNYTENTTYEKLNPKSVQIHENGCIPKLKNNTYVNVSINNSTSSPILYDDDTSSIMSQSMYNMPSNNCLTTMQQRNVYGSNPNLTDNTKSQLNNSIYNNNHNHNNNIKLTTPSPSFNRNPSYRNVTPLTSTKHFNDDVANDMLAKRKSGSLSELSKVIIRDNNTIVNIPTNSIEDLTQVQRISHDNSSGHDFNTSNQTQHHNERFRDQEIEKAEHARLEEILNMCAEYEKQAQCERITTKSVPTPNRIKTNGSLPRDKRSSPTVQQLNDEPVFKFDFDSSSTPTTSSPNHYHQQYQNKTNWCARNNLNTYENVSINKFPSPSLDNSNHHTPKYENVELQKVHPSPYENVTLQHQQMNYHPQSPRTRIKTYVTANKSDTNNGYNKPDNNSYKEDYDYLEQFINNTKTIFNDSFNKKQSLSGANSSNLQHTPDSSPVITKSPQQLSNASTPNGLSKVLTDRFMNENLLHEMSNYKVSMNGCNDLNDIKTSTNTDQVDTVLKEKNNNEMSTGNGVNSLGRKSKKDIMTTVITEEKNKCIEKLTMERNKIQNSISNVKSKIADIENQEEELIRELELEKSLISGEYRSEMSALNELEKGKAALMERIELMEQEIENSKLIQERQQNDTKIKLKEAQDNVTRLQNELANCEKTSPEYSNIQLTLTKSQDMLENERKCFEDLEFHHLEHEANLLATREELQREIQDITQQIDKRTKQIQELDAQKIEAFDHTTHESKELERNLLTCLRNLEEHRNRLRSIDTELESLTGQKLDYYSDNELISDEDSADSIKSQLKNKLENIKLLKNQLSNMEKENMRRDSSSIDKKQQKIKSSQEHKQHQSLTTPAAPPTSPSSTATYQVNGINTENSSSYSKQIDIMSQSFHEMFLNDKSSPDTRLFKPQQQQNASKLLSMSFHENFLKFGHLSPEGKTPSQDDIDRISKVTLDAPMDLGENTASLGRKTIESLKEIERVRQIHLIQQGSHVIEEERKRVSELKRRVQNEVRAEWEERRQRECNSLNSVGSEESAVTSSEGNSGITRESVAESEEAEEKTKHSVTFNTTTIQHESSQRRNSQIDKGDLSDYDRRPLSESSDVSYETQLSVKPRPRSLSSPQQRPLTRYLPIRSDNLNLKQHIESAGHQVDLCPHVILDSTTCRGYLNKMGSRFHSWNKRWFVFDRVKRIFVYFPDRHEKKRRGGAYFQAIEEVYLDHLNTVKSPNPQLTFIVKTHERTYHLMAPSPEAMRIWIDVIFTGAEGYQEFEHGT